MKPHGEEFLVSVCYHRSPEQRIRRGDVMADMGIPCPDPPPTDAEMQEVAFAAKMAMAKVLASRKRAPRADCRWCGKSVRLRDDGELYQWWCSAPNHPEAANQYPTHTNVIRRRCRGNRPKRLFRVRAKDRR